LRGHRHINLLEAIKDYFFFLLALSQEFGSIHVCCVSKTSSEKKVLECEKSLNLEEEEGTRQSLLLL